MISIIICNVTPHSDPADYTVRVSVNSKLVDTIHITGHNRADSWRVLVLEAVAPGMLEACEEMGAWFDRGCPMKDGLPSTPGIAMAMTAAAKVRGDE